jgi:hypothetical protein
MLQVRMHFEFLPVVKGVDRMAEDGWPLSQAFGCKDTATFPMNNQIARWLLVLILLRSLKSVVLNAIPNLGVKCAWERHLSIVRIH